MTATAGDNWMDRIARGLAGARPALPNQPHVHIPWWRRWLNRLASRLGYQPASDVIACKITDHYPPSWNGPKLPVHIDIQFKGRRRVTGWVCPEPPKTP